MSRTLSGLKQPVTDLDGQPLMEVSGRTIVIGSLLANSLARGQSREPARAMDLALKLHNNTEDTYELEDADFDLLNASVVADQFLNNMAKAAALEALAVPG